MKKITDFIVDKKYFILPIFILLTIVSIFLSDRVKINYDIAKYLPSFSNTRIGMDIMEKEFPDSKSTLNIMVKDLTVEEKENSYQYLENLDGVDAVSYDDSNRYNRDEYTLFVLTIDADADSKRASAIFDAITDYFKDDLVDTSGNVSDENKEVLPFYIVVLAVVSALIILIIMSESYVEPFLFLTSILIAVALNKGTNLIFPSVSHITNSISAILQMALSMDYSIMLMNRYRQERQKNDDKVIAMKKALYNAFKAISSSSITTIVGLLALVFMSFTIGRDLGFVLAKGVLFSLLSIFTCLPALILIFDKWILKTKKRSPIIKLDSMGKIAHRLRHLALLLFIIIFVASYFLKGNLGILYTASGTDQIDKTFKLNNQIAIIYDNRDEKNISDYCNGIEENGEIEEVLCYGNTINLPLKYDALNDKLADLGSTVSVEDYLLKIVYYHYYNGQENNKITLKDLVDFIEKDVYDNEKMSKEIDAETKEDIAKLKNLVNSDLVNKKRNYGEIANLLSMDEETIKDLLVYYHSKNVTSKMSLNQFVNFMNNSILNDKKYASSVDDNTRKNLSKMRAFIDKNTITKKRNSDQISSLFGLDKQMVDDLFTYYLLTGDIDYEITLHDFVNFITTELLNNPQYSDSFTSPTMKEKIEMLLKFSDKEKIDKEMDIDEMADFLGVDKDQIGIFFMQQSTFKPHVFIDTLLKFVPSTDPDYANYQMVKQIMDSAMNDQKYDYGEMSQFPAFPADTTKNIYCLMVSADLRLSPYEFVQFLLEHSDDEVLEKNLSKDVISDLTFVKQIMTSVIAEKKYTTNEMAKFLNVDKDTLDLVYSLYDSRKSPIKISYKDFITFLNDDVINDKKYKSSVSEKQKEKLKIAKKIIYDSLKKVDYTNDAVYDLLVPLSGDIDKDLIDLVYIYYGSIEDYHEEWTLTIEEFVNYLNETILNDERFDSYIDEDMHKDIIDGKQTIKDTKALLVGNKYSRVVINTWLDPEGEKTFAFIEDMQNDLKGLKTYIIGNSPMAYEMNQTFGDELNLITILTMIFIFIVVAFTFKSVLIPIILVLLIQCAVFLTMGILSFGGSVYFISILIVQSILMGATIDYAIVYTSYYIEARNKKDVKKSLISAYNNSIHTILTSATILVIVTLIVGYFASAVAAKICMTLSQGTLCSSLLIIFLLPAVLSSCDKFIIKKKN